MPAINLPTFYQDPTLTAARLAEVTDADFVGGMNKGASCAPGLGINTGDINPKTQDWATPIGVPAAHQTSQSIGQTATSMFTLDPATAGDDELLAFVTATGAVVPGGTIETVNALAVVNRSDSTMQSGDSAWGVSDQP